MSTTQRKRTAESEGNMDFMQKGPSNCSLFNPAPFEGLETAKVGQKQKQKPNFSCLLIPVIASSDSLAWVFLEYGYVKSEETAPGNAFSQKISFFFSSPSNHLCDGTALI